MPGKLNQQRPLHIKLLLSFASKDHLKKSITNFFHLISCIQLLVLILSFEYESMDGVSILSISIINFLQRFDNYLVILLDNNINLAIGICSLLLVSILSFIFYEIYCQLSSTRNKRIGLIFHLLLKIHANLFFYWIHKFFINALAKYDLNSIQIFLSIAILLTNSAITFVFILFCFSIINIDGYICRKTSTHIFLINLIKAIIPILTFLDEDSINIYLLDEILMSIILSLIMAVVLRKIPEYNLRLNKLIASITSICLTLTISCILGSLFKEKERFLVIGILTCPVFSKLSLMNLDKTIEMILSKPNSIHDEDLQLHIPILLNKIGKNFDINLKKRHINDPNFLIRGMMFEKKVQKGKELDWFMSYNNSIMKTIFDKNTSKMFQTPLKIQEIHFMIYNLNTYLKAYSESQHFISKTKKLGYKLALYILIDKIDEIISDKKIEKNAQKNESFIFMLDKDFTNLKLMMENYCNLQESLWKNIQLKIIDLAEQNELAKKIKKTTLEIDTIWQRIEKNHKAQKSFPHLLYGTFLSKFQNLPFHGKKVLDKYERILEKQRYRLQDQIFTDSYFTIAVEALPPKMGRIISASSEFLSVFGFKKDVTKKNINSIMPNFYKNQHDAFMLNFFQTGKAKLIQKPNEFLAKRNDGFIIPIEIFVTVDTDNDHGVIYRTSMRKIHTKYQYVIVNSSGCIEEFSSTIGNQLNLISGINLEELLLKENKHLAKDLLQFLLSPGSVTGTLGKLPGTVIGSLNHTQMELNYSDVKPAFANSLNYIHMLLEKGSFIFLKPYSGKSLRTLNYLKQFDEIPFHIKIKILRHGNNCCFVLKLKKIDGYINSNEYEDLNRSDLDFFMTQEFFDKQLDGTGTQFENMNRANGASLTILPINPDGKKATSKTNGSHRAVHVVPRSVSRSSLNPEEKLSIKIERVEEIFREKPRDWKRKSIEIIFSMILITTLILSFVLYLESKYYLNSIEEGINITVTSYKRLESILWCWRMMLSFSVRYVGIKAFNPIDFERFKTVMGQNFVIFKEKNAELRQMIADNLLYAEFFLPNVKLLDKDLYGNMKYRQYDLFTSGELLVTKMIQYSSQPNSIKLAPNNSEFNFLLQNIQNDFMVESIKLLDVSDLNLANLQETNTGKFRNIMISSSILMLIGIGVLIWNYALLKIHLENLAEALISFSYESIDEHLNNLRLFREMVITEDQDSRNKLLAKSKTIITKKVEVKNVKNFINPVKMKIYPTKLIRLFIMIVLLDALLIGLFGITYTQTLGSVDGFVESLKEVKSLSIMGFVTNLAICTDFYLFVDLQNGVLFNQPVSVLDTQIFKAIDNNILINEFVGSNGKYKYPLIETFFIGDFCSIVENKYSYPGRNMSRDCWISTAGHTLGILSINIQLYQLSNFLSETLKANSTFANVLKNYHYIDEYITQYSYTLKVSYEEMSNFVFEQYENKRNPTYDSLLTSFLLEFIFQAIISIICVSILVLIINRDEIYQNLLPLFPLRELLKSKFLKYYLIKLYDHKINFIININPE